MLQLLNYLKFHFYGFWIISVNGFLHTILTPLWVTTSTSTTQPISTFLKILFFTSSHTMYSQLIQFTKYHLQHFPILCIYCNIFITYGFTLKSRIHHPNSTSSTQIFLPDSLSFTLYLPMNDNTLSGLYTHFFHFFVQLLLNLKTPQSSYLPRFFCEPSIFLLI
jgi:hypothetical protein